MFRPIIGLPLILLGLWSGSLAAQQITLDFEELVPGTWPIVSQGYEVSGVANLTDANGDNIVETDNCDPMYGCYLWSATQTITATDGSPFAFYSVDITGPCAGNGCGIWGMTTWGEYVYTSSTPIGTGGWLSLQSVNIGADDVNGFCQWGNSELCWFAIDDVVLQGATGAEIDFDPWSTANEIRPKDDYVIAVELKTTSIADGDAFDFNAALVDTTSLRLGPDGAEFNGVPLPADYDGDGDTDYIFSFRMEDTGNTCADASIVLAGNTTGGVPFAAKDSVTPINCEEPMPIDVEPYSAANRVYPDDTYLVQVAVLETQVANGDPYDFDADDASRYSLRFGPAEAQYETYVQTDVDGDGDTDKVYTFQMQETGIACGDTEVTLTGEKWTGGDLTIPLVGTDTIQTEDCVTESCHP
jgi:hypothetical protein